MKNRRQEDAHARANRRFRMAGIAVCCSCLLLCLAQFVDGSLLWLSSADERVNSLRTAQTVFSVQVVDEFEPPQTPLTPGTEFSKTVSAVNSGEQPGFVRVMVLPTIVAADEMTLLPADIGDQVEADVDPQYWADGGDGYYYYLGELAAGATTPPLLERAKLAEGLSADYDGATLAIEVKCEAVTTRTQDYRYSWWGQSGAPADSTLRRIDTALQQHAQP